MTPESEMVGADLDAAVARARAAVNMPEVATLFLRDMRKRAANLSATDDDAARLLQHSNKAITNTHYRTRGERVRPVR